MKHFSELVRVVGMFPFPGRYRLFKKKSLSEGGEKKSKG